jgi:hypothetical protein
VCSFLRVMGCTTDERSGCSFVARSQPRRMARCSSTPGMSTPRPMVTLYMGMPVSWQRRFSVSSATLMLVIMVPSTFFAVASVSPAARRWKPSLMSGGRIFSARM